MGTHHPDGGYSAEVRISLQIGDTIYEVSSIGPGSMRLRAPAELIAIRSGEVGTLTVSIDGVPVASTITVNRVDGEEIHYYEADRLGAS